MFEELEVVKEEDCEQSVLLYDDFGNPYMVAKKYACNPPIRNCDSKIKVPRYNKLPSETLLNFSSPIRYLKEFLSKLTREQKEEYLINSINEYYTGGKVVKFKNGDMYYNVGNKGLIIATAYELESGLDAICMNYNGYIVDNTI